MTRIQLACYGLLASAFILAALLMNQLPSLTQAHANETVTQPEYVFTTALTEANGDSLFILDKVNHVVIVYNLETRGNSGIINVSNFVRVADLLR